VTKGAQGTWGPRLTRGAKIAVVSPASTVRREAFEAGLAKLASWGYEPVLGRFVRRTRGDLAGSDDDRAADLAWALAEADVDAVWAARGGWGSARLFDLVPAEALTRSDRWLIGFSDLTSLLLARAAAGAPALHAPLVADLGASGRVHVADLRAWLEGEGSLRRWLVSGPRQRLVSGRASGRLVGGCLSVVASLVGTRHLPSLDGAILVLEEVGEAPYRIDRLLWQIRASGVLDGVRGLVFGHFTRCARPPGRPSRTTAEVLAEHAQALGVPALAGAPVGHGPRTRSFPLGAPARLDVARGLLEIGARRRGGRS
jgi:muramoyltetrapeptide carboxypeptidase